MHSAAVYIVYMLILCSIGVTVCVLRLNLSCAKAGGFTQLNVLERGELSSLPPDHSHVLIMASPNTEAKQKVRYLALVGRPRVSNAD